MAMVNAAGTDFAGLDEQMGVLQDTFVGPFIASARKWCARVGGSSLPLAGCGSFVCAREEDWLIVVLPMSSLLSTGIVHQNIESFCKTDHGVAWFGECTKTYFLKAGWMMWIPYGHTALYMHVTDKAAASKENGMGHLLVFPVLSQKLAVETDGNVWTNIVASNEDAHKGKTESVWKQAVANLKLIADAAKPSPVG